MELDKAWNNLKNVDQLDSAVSNVEQIESSLNEEEPISSEIQNYTEVMSAYKGVENDLIDVEVDNTNKTIEAKSKTFVFEQGIAASTWVIEHNLNKYPSVTVIDSAGDQVFANLNYVDENELVLDFGAEFAGKAYLN